MRRTNPQKWKQLSELAEETDASVYDAIDELQAEFDTEIAQLESTQRREQAELDRDIREQKKRIEDDANSTLQSDLQTLKREYEYELYEYRDAGKGTFTDKYRLLRVTHENEKHEEEMRKEQIERERMEERNLKDWQRDQARAVAEWEKDQEKALKEQEAQQARQAEEERWAPRPFKP